jgi:DHA1 family bicyclomycin/chloramphenicol resistance-like MFS transporter
MTSLFDIIKNLLYSFWQINKAFSKDEFMTIPAQKNKKEIHFIEFISFLALSMSLVALSIDAMLPALPDIIKSYGISNTNSQQYVITFLFMGLSIGQLIAGPLSDSIGRKKGIYAGLTLFIFGSLLAYFAQNFETILAGRFIQGLGASAPRIVTIAIIRDRYEGREMARVMSYIMGIFVVVPALAPTIGQGIIMLTGWQSIFIFFIAIALVIFIWLAVRIPETQRPEDSRPFTIPVLWQGLIVTLGNTKTLCYMIAAGLIYGSFIGYLNTSQQIFEDYYHVGKLFPLYFGITAISLGVAFFTNAQLVRVFGMKKVIVHALIIVAILAAIFITLELSIFNDVPLPMFMIYIMASTFCMGMLFGNFNALAMEPMGHMAGIAAAVIGCVSLIISILVGGIVGQLYNDNLLPLALGFLIGACGSLIMMRIAEDRIKLT